MKERDVTTEEQPSVNKFKSFTDRWRYNSYNYPNSKGYITF